MKQITRLNSEKSQLRSKGTLKRGSGTFISNAKDYKDEEMLVINYIAIVIRLLKFSDGLKAIDEYKKKVGLSKRAEAHLLKFQGVLTLLSEKKEYNEAIKHFNEAFKLFHKVRSSKGRAI